LQSRLSANPPRPMRGAKRAVDGCHDPTMRRRLAARMRGRLRICGFLCRHRADAGWAPVSLGCPAPSIAWQGISTLP
jgi:hypothetical protein